MSSYAKKIALALLISCIVFPILIVGRNYVTGAKMNSTDSAHVMDVGERATYLVAPNSYMPSSYIRISGMTWLSWGGSSSWGYGRVAARWPGGLMGGDSGWARIEVSCPVNVEGTSYYSQYSLEWLDGDYDREMDGWESGEVNILNKDCAGKS